MTFTLFTNDLCCYLNWTGGSRKDDEDEDQDEDAPKKKAFKDLQCRRVLESELHIFKNCAVLVYSILNQSNATNDLPL